MNKKILLILGAMMIMAAMAIAVHAAFNAVDTDGWNMYTAGSCTYFDQSTGNPLGTNWDYCTGSHSMREFAASGIYCYSFPATIDPLVGYCSGGRFIDY